MGLGGEFHIDPLSFHYVHLHAYMCVKEDNCLVSWSLATPGAHKGVVPVS